MHNFTKLGVAAVIASLPVMTSAATISTASVTQTTQVNSFNGVESNTEREIAPNGTAMVGGIFGGSSATQNADGTSSVSATTGAQGFGAGSGTTKITSQAVWGTTETNSFAEDRAFTLDFELEDLSTILRTTRNYGDTFVNPFDSAANEITNTAFTAASFQYTINVNGTDVYSARADVLGKTTFDSTTFERGQEYTFENVNNFNASISQDPLNSELFNFVISDLSDTIELGVFAGGADLNITSTLTAIAQSRSFEGENGVGAFSADPITLSSFGNIQSTAVTTTPVDPVTPVPLPAAGWMLIAGVGGLSAMKRRKKA
jgi:hypothetical protein